MAAWLGVVGGIGVMRFVMRAFDDGRFAADAVAWMWLVGGLLAIAAAVAAWAHERA